MCGILGGNNNKWNYKEGIQALFHRGPNSQRVQKLENCTMAFARLAIRDLSENGMQPMTSQDGNVTVVYNGEIYGYALLKKELSKTYPFYSNSDTEVILNAYLAYGDRFIDKIDGMFSIAIYDKREMHLKLYRDRTGIKPLYYFYRNGQFAFASEIKALLATCIDVRWDIDYTALYDYLFYQYIPDPKTMYKDCCKLPPACMLDFDLRTNRINKIQKYWKLHVNTAQGRTRKEEVLCEDLRNILKNSVKKQLEADVLVGCFLSGGIDSSIITYESNQCSPNIHTYSIGFYEQKYNELNYAEMLIQRYNLNSTKKIVDFEDINPICMNLRKWYDEPFADTSAYPSYIVSELAKKDVTVVLTGDGGDELFGGYDRYRWYADAYCNRHSTLLNKIEEKIGIEKFFNIGLKEYLPYISIVNKFDVEYYRKKWKIGKDYDPFWNLKKFYKKELPVMTRMRYLDYKTYLPGDILTKLDRVSMANSLEARVPFLGREVVEFAFSLSEEECCNSYMLKKILKEAYKEVIPEKILYRKKKGFSVPDKFFISRGKNIPITCKLLEQEWKEFI